MDGLELDPEESPVATGQWAGSWDASPMQAELGDNSSMHAMNATTAAYHADIAAKHAAQLAQYVQYLSGTLGQLHQKVSELEDWKRGALEDVRTLRDEHKALKQRVLGEERADENGSTSSSALESVPPGPPPGLLGGLDSSPSSSLGETALVRNDTTDTLMSGTTSGVSSGVSSRSLLDTDPGSKDDGVTVTDTKIDGVECQHAEWRIANLSTKLRGCMGRALVSSPFSALGMHDLRLMIYPDGKDVAQGPRSRRHKELYAKKITEGPLDGRLSLKIPSCPEDCCDVQCYYMVGSSRRGPFTHNFSESTVGECDDFGVDWLKELESDQSLVVCVDVSLQTSSAKGESAPEPSS